MINRTPPPACAEQAEMFSNDGLSAPTAATNHGPAEKEGPLDGVRLHKADRSQVSWGRIDLEAQLPADHAARAIWAVLERLDLSALYVQIESRGRRAGAPAIDPKILLALWIFAVSEGETSAREIERLTSLHVAYRWICGGVAVNYHTLSDFRTQQSKIVSDLITQVLGLLMKQNLIALNRVAQDGTRVRASAGAKSFRRKGSLEAMMAEARAHLEALDKEAADPVLSERRRAAQRRAAESRLARLEAALAEIPEVAATKKRNGKKADEARASTTDAKARVMKMGDGGFRPAYNVQFATTTDDARVIVGVAVTNRGTDMGETTPMIDQVEQRTGRKPEEIVVDGGYVALDAIDAAAEKGVTFYGPVPEPRKGEPDDRYARHERDSQPVSEWRERMSRHDVKEIYKLRAATAETVNADAKTHRGLDSLPVRGPDKVLGCALFFALTYNILRLLALGGLARLFG